MKYLTYLSKCRRGLNIDVEKERQYNYNRYVTKAYEDDSLPIGDYMYRRMFNTIGLPLPVSINNAYVEFTIPKRSGGVRVIHAPCDELKDIQRKILKHLNASKVLPHNAVHSFQSFRNCKTALQVHQKNHSRWFLKLDIQDYFTSITHPFMYRELSKNLRLSTADITNWLGYCFKDGVLPQGAPTSPILSNLYLLEFDYRLTEKLKELDKNFVYTRYADDILISCRNSFRFDDVVLLVKELLQPFNCTIKDRKTRYGSFNGSNWNLGIMYNNQFNLTVGYKAKHLLKNRVHNLFTGDLPHDSTEFTHELAVIRGLLAYYSYIEPDYFRPLVKKWRDKGYDI